LRSDWLPIEVLIENYGLVHQGDQIIEARKEILIYLRAVLTVRMDELQKTLDLLNYKISVYENALVKKSKN
jgi:hypothetical protein